MTRLPLPLKRKAHSLPPWAFRSQPCALIGILETISSVVSPEICAKRRSLLNNLGQQCCGPSAVSMLGSKLLATWQLLYLISSQNALADLVEVLAGLGGCVEVHIVIPC